MFGDQERELIWTSRNLKLLTELLFDEKWRVKASGLLHFGDIQGRVVVPYTQGSFFIENRAAVE